MHLSEPTTNGHQCILCPWNCDLSIGEVGNCGVRRADETGVHLTAYGHITTIAVEPIEKKPIFHFHPSMKVLSAGGYGCNMKCGFCQNWSVSQRDRSGDSRIILPARLVQMAQERSCGAVCLTYNEPTIAIEYLLDLADQCHENDLLIILKTNGMVNPEPWEMIYQAVDAMNIDLKDSQGLDHFYSTTKAPFQFADIIRDNIISAEYNTHIEISIPIYDETDPEVLAEDLLFFSTDIPIHLLKIFPANEWEDYSAVDDDILIRCRKEIMRMSPHVYLGNVFNRPEYRTTTCPHCSRDIMHRKGLKVEILAEKDDVCDSNRCLLKKLNG